MTKLEKKSKGDYLQAAVRGGLGAIPIAGAAVTELLNLIVTPPLERRRLEWMKEIGERLRILEDTKDINLEELRDNDEFIDTVIFATQVALRTSVNEKHEYLKNAITNAIINESIDKSLHTIYLHLIERLSVWHIKILDFIDDPKHWFEINNKVIPDSLNQSILGSVLIPLLTTAFPELSGKTDFVEILWNDLHQYGLNNTSSFKGIMSSLSLWDSRTTKFGKGFLLFIKNPL